MTPERWRDVETVLAAVLVLPENQQTAYLDGVCVGAPELRAEIESLLAVRHRAESLLEIRSPLVGSRVGNYRLIREIGRGGMGAVYQAERADGQFEQTVAIKVVASPLRSLELERRFREERQILAMLEHPHIARLLDGGVTPDGLPYLVMEYVDGRTLIEYCNANGLSINQRLELFQTICSAVAFAHQRLIVHRDIKPGNILITGEGVPKLVDFGIAKVVGQVPAPGSTLTAAHLPPMTPEYASPEQIRGGFITTATDVYSLGVVLFELLTGHRPYRLAGVTFEEATQIVCHREAPRPSQLQPGTPRDLDAIVAMAMRKEPAGRYSSPQELGADVGRYLAGLPVTAHRGSRTYRARKFLSRHRLAVGLSAAALVAACAGVFAIVRQERIAQRRFQQVRSLANSVMYELHDGIAALPGSTQVRRLLVTRASQYLEALSKEAGGNTELQLELAAAYGRVAAVQGNPSWSNLGDPEGALATYRKSEAILQSVLAAEPQNWKAHRRLAQVHLDKSTILVFQRKFDAAGASVNAALPHWKLLNDRFPKDEEAIVGAASAYYALADVLSRSGKIEERIANRRKALELFERLLAAHPGEDRHMRNVALTLKSLGTEVGMTGRVDEARAHYRRAMDLDRRRVATLPNNAIAKLDLSFDLGELGSSYHQSDPETALDLYEQSLTLRRELAAADPSDARVQGRLAFALRRVAGLHSALRRDPEAVKELGEVIAIGKALLANSPGDMPTRSNLAGAHRDLGVAAEKMAAADPAHAASHHRRACDAYRESLAVFRDLEGRGAMQEDERKMAAEVSKHLAGCSL